MSSHETKKEDVTCRKPSAVGGWGYEAERRHVRGTSCTPSYPCPRCTSPRRTPAASPPGTSPWRGRLRPRRSVVSHVTKKTDDRSIPARPWRWRRRVRRDARSARGDADTSRSRIPRRLRVLRGGRGLCGSGTPSEVFAFSSHNKAPNSDGWTPNHDSGSVDSWGRFPFPAGAHRVANIRKVNETKTSAPSFFKRHAQVERGVPPLPPTPRELSESR